MVTESIAAKRARAHTVYKDQDGRRLPGVTTVLGVLNKPALVPWANGLGLAGINVREYVDVLARIGTMGHDMIMHHHKGEEAVFPDDAPDLVSKAENCLLSYLAWAKGKSIEPILYEVPLVSEQYSYGGTVDFYGMVDGVPTIVDYKTGKAIYAEHVYQVSAYRQLLEEHGYRVDEVRILQIGRSEDEGFSEKVVTDTSREWRIFELCLELRSLAVGK